MPPHTCDDSIVTTQVSTTLNAKEEKTSPSAPSSAVFGFISHIHAIGESSDHLHPRAHPDNGQVYDTVKALKGRCGGRLIGG
ncbi:hypothetical protein B0H13DRAFT_2359305 [Mycena leptocephala]|nr:hypothetical protein B0H13DRAFT_2359305 [Mycena leptocephala]